MLGRIAPRISTMSSLNRLKLIDIGANLLDEMYSGSYNSKPYHGADLDAVLERSWASGVSQIIITAGSLSEARSALELARRDDRLFCTVGVHPTRCGEFDAHPGGPAQYLEDLRNILEQGRGKVVAIGECGLDYERLQFCAKEIQLQYFRLQFELAKSSGLPMFLHLRGACTDFMQIINDQESMFSGGVVHSFDGTIDDLNQVLSVRKLSIGINGCSLKSEDNLKTMGMVPVDRLMIETDCPWCDIRNTHAGKQYVKSSVLDAKDKKKHGIEFQVKGRNEPSNLRQVLEVVAGFRGVAIESLAEQIWINTTLMFKVAPFPP